MVASALDVEQAQQATIYYYAFLQVLGMDDHHHHRRLPNTLQYHALDMVARLMGSRKVQLHSTLNCKGTYHAALQDHVLTGQ